MRNHHPPTSCLTAHPTTGASIQQSRAPIETGVNWNECVGSTWYIHGEVLTTCPPPPYHAVPTAHPITGASMQQRRMSMGTKVSWNECVSDAWYVPVCSCRSTHYPPACPLPPYHAIVQLITVSVQFEGAKISIPIQVESISHHN